MDSDFFDFSKDFVRTLVSAGYINGRKPVLDLNPRHNTRAHGSKEYAIEHRKKAENILLESSMANLSLNYSRMDTVDEDFDESIPNPKTDILEIYEKYNFDITIATNLTIHSSKYKILSKINSSPTVIVEGPTGCGKSTQIPQYILDEARQKNIYCNIIVTQPRKIAAISLAKRVCDERQWQLGTIVGYQVGLNAQVNNDTRLLYCTTGILLQKLIYTKTLAAYTHIIIDEVHERDSEMDFLLITIKKLLAESYDKVKIILMSATINAEELSEYFKIPRKGIFVDAPIITLDRKKIYNVNEFYLCQLDLLKPDLDINYDKPRISDSLYITALKLMIICKRLDENEPSNDLAYKPSILVFLPGIYEIEVMYKTIEKWQMDNRNKDFIVLPLHSSITTEEQSKIFYPPPPGLRKIILSTNIAESSITVPDIKYVIDFCLTKNLITDPITNFSGLKLQWASKSNCKQRAGRAGRVMNGRVYRLVSKRFYDIHIQESGVPEILRSPLEQIVLKAKMLDMGPPHSILALAISPPNLSDIANTILVLKSVGALYQTVAGNYDALDGDLTYMGRIMSGLPLDIRATKLIILGYIFNVLNEAIIIASGLSVRNIFATPFNETLQAYFQKLCWADGSGSDLFAILNAYTVWEYKKQQNLFHNDETELGWGKRYYIEIRAMRELYAQINEIKNRLKRYNITEIRSNEKLYWTKQEKQLVLKTVISGAFYPHYFHRSSVNDREAFQAIGGLDPSKTVYLKGLDPKHFGILYEQRIKEIFKPIAHPNDIKITFDSNSQRLFATFLKGDQYYNKNSDEELNLVSSMPGQVLLEVYKACKMAKLNFKHQIEVLSSLDAYTFVKQHQIGVIENGRWHLNQTKSRKLGETGPPLNIKQMKGIVTHIVHCNKFFFQPNHTCELLKKVDAILKPTNLVPFGTKHQTDMNKSEIIAAPFINDANEIDHHKYCRAQIIEFDKTVVGENYYLVYYIDYGNTSSVKFSNLRRIMCVDDLKYIQPCVFQCYLCGIQPSCFISTQELWTDNTIEELKQFTKNSKLVTIEVFSFVNGVASVRLRNEFSCINDELVQKGLAQIAEESYMSNANHEFRERKQESLLDNNFDQYINSEDDEFITNKIVAPPRDLCREKVTLFGPYSPLETQMFPLMRFTEYNSAKIDPHSINSVLLDALSTFDSRKLIVAAEVGLDKNSTIIARNTTLMPNIKGFDVLMGLLFCPTMELKRDCKNTRYSAVLTGLGYNKKTLKPFDSEHDIIFKMDVEITIEDLEKINAIRYYMDTLLHTFSGEDYPQLDDSVKIQIMNQINAILPQILEKPRRSFEVVSSQNDDQWGTTNEEDMIKMTDVYGCRTIFPVHTAIYLEEPKCQDLLKLQNNCAELYKIAKLKLMSVPVTCLLCNQNLENITEVRIHLYTLLHLDREKQINFSK